MSQTPLFVWGNCTQLGCQCVSYEDTEFASQCLCCHMKNHHAKYVVNNGQLIPIPTSIVQQQQQPPPPPPITTSSIFGISVQQSPQLSPASLVPSIFPNSLNEPSSSSSMLGELEFGRQDYQNDYQKEKNFWADTMFDLEIDNDIDKIIDSPSKTYNDMTLSRKTLTDKELEDKTRNAAELLFNFIKKLESKGQQFVTSSELTNFYLKHPDMKDNIRLAGGFKHLIFKYHWNFFYVIDQDKKKEMLKTKSDTFKGDSKVNYEKIITENNDLHFVANHLLGDYIKNYGDDNGKVIRADSISQFYGLHSDIDLQKYFQKFGGLLNFCFSRKGNFFPYEDFHSHLILIRFTFRLTQFDTDSGNSNTQKVENGNSNGNGNGNSNNTQKVDLINDVYSTKLDITSFTKVQISRAARIAKEIESNSNMRNICVPEDLDVTITKNENTLRVSQLIIKYIKPFGDRMRLDSGLGLLYNTFPEIKQVIHDVGGFSAFCSLFPSLFKIENDNTGIKYLTIINDKQKLKTNDSSYDSDDDDWKTQKTKKTNIKNRKEGLLIAESLFNYIAQKKENKKLREKNLHKFYAVNPQASKVIEEYGGIANFCQEFRELFIKPVVDLQQGGMLILIRRTQDR